MVHCRQCSSMRSIEARHVRQPAKFTIIVVRDPMPIVMAGKLSVIKNPFVRIYSISFRLLEDPTLIQNELNRRMEAARDSSPTKRRQETLNRDLIRVRKSMERLLTAYLEELLTLDELRVRMPPLRQREQAMQAINHQTADRAAYLQLAETLTAFLERLR